MPSSAPPVATPATVFVVDDNPVVRRSLRWLIGSIGMPVEDFSSAVEYLDTVDPARPGCLVADVRLPRLSGVDLLDQVRARASPVPVILLTGHADVPLAVRAMRGGAFDFFEKPCNDQLLLERIQQAVRVDKTNRARWAEREAARARLRRLSAREHEVLLLILDGLANKEMARKLGLSIKTVETHRARVCQKLGVDHPAGLVRLASAAGIDLPPAADTAPSGG